MKKNKVIEVLGVVTLLTTLGAFSHVAKAHELGSNLKPIAFGKDQTIIDFDKVVWSPLEVEGLDTGAEIALIRGDLDKDHSESIVRLPANYFVNMHSHTSDELYLWISGAYTLISEDGRKQVFNGPSYISFPGNAPKHAIQCGSKEPCLFYLRYSRPFDMILPVK